MGLAGSVPESWKMGTEKVLQVRMEAGMFAMLMFAQCLPALCLF